MDLDKRIGNAQCFSKVSSTSRLFYQASSVQGAENCHQSDMDVRHNIIAASQES